MKKLQRILSIALVGALGAPAAWAAINNSHHDMSTWLSSANEEVCLPCHGGVDTSSAAGYGTVGALCVTRCHAGAGGANKAQSALPIPNRPASANDDGTPQAPSATLNAINVGFAHGLTKSDLVAANTGAGVVAWHATGTALPYGAAGIASMQCTTCHNVHDNTNTPFLQRPLFTGGPTADRSFCEVCHFDDRGNNWQGADGSTTEVLPNGEHPVNFGLILTTVNTRTLGGRVGRYIQLDTYGGTRVYDVPTPNGAANLQTQAQNYVTGGHVGSATWGTAVNGNTFGCYTCHSAHIDSGATARLVLRDTVSTTPAQLNQWNPLCVGCHGRSAPSATEYNEQNPGLTNFFHPTGTGAPTATSTAGAPGAVTFPSSTAAAFTFNVNLTAIAGYVAPGSLTASNGVGIDTVTYKPRCTSCHDVHGGVTGTMAVADLDGTVNGTMTGAVCYQCHQGGDLVDVADGTNAGAPAAGELANGHHRTHSGAIGATVLDADGDTLTVDTASWSGAALATGDTFGSMADGLQCPDCHVFNGTAHNW